MLLWLQRWLAYLLLPAGLILAFVPLCTHRLENAKKDFFYLEISKTLAAGKPAQADLSSAKPDSAKNAWEQMMEKQEQQAREDARAAATTNVYGYPRIRPDDLASYPALRKELDGMRRTIGYSPYDHLDSARKENVPVEEWIAFRQAAGLSGEDDAFQYGKYIFKGQVRKQCVSTPIEIRHLKTGCKTAGVLFLVLGLWAIYGAYPPPPAGGIRVGRKSAAIIWDVIIIIVGGVFTWWFLEFILKSVFQTSTEWVEDFSVGMGVFWVVLVYPVLALTTTAMSVQTLWISKNTITLKGLFGASTVKWSEVESIRVSQAFSPRAVGGLPASHRVMKILQISAGRSTLSVLEPPYAATKKEIISALMQNAPEAHKPRIETAAKEWLAYL